MVDPVTSSSSRRGGDEDVYLATLDLDALREYRGRETMGDAYRKPGAYRRLLSDEHGVPIFDRSDSRRGSPGTEGEEVARTLGQQWSIRAR